MRKVVSWWSVCCIQQTVPTSAVHVDLGEGDKVTIKEEGVGGGRRRGETRSQTGPHRPGGGRRFGWHSHLASLQLDQQEDDDQEEEGGEDDGDHGHRGGGGGGEERVKSLGSRVDDEEKRKGGGVELLLLSLAADAHPGESCVCRELKTPALPVLVLPGSAPREGGGRVRFICLATELDHLSF